MAGNMGCGCMTVMNFSWNSAGPVVEIVRCAAHAEKTILAENIDRSF